MARCESDAPLADSADTDTTSEKWSAPPCVDTDTMSEACTSDEAAVALTSESECTDAVSCAGTPDVGTSAAVKAVVPASGHGEAAAIVDC